MHVWPLDENDRAACFRSMDKSSWEMQSGFGNKEELYRPIIRRLREALPSPLDSFEAGCRQCQSSNSWLMLWYDGLKCIHFELDVRNRRDGRAGSALIGVHVEGNRQLQQQLADYLSEYLEGSEDLGQLYGKRIRVDVYDEVAARQIADEMVDMIRRWVPLMCEAMSQSTRL